MQWRCRLADKGNGMYKYRNMEKYVKRANGQFPVLLVTGPRQVGKTTILRHLSNKKRTYVTLDDPTLCSLAREEPGLFFQRFQPPLLIDEIQYAPQLLPYIKMQVDQKRDPGMFWLTGSQHFHLMKNVSESLAGRICILNLLGLSSRELQDSAKTAAPFLPTKRQVASRLKHGNSLTLKKLYHQIWRGSFPVIALDKKIERDLFFSSYVQTYLQRDIRDLANVGNEMAFLRFLRAVAARTGQLLNLADLARDADVSPNTAKNWLSILQTSGIIYLLEPYYNNLTKRMVKAPKLYFIDTGLCSYLTEWSSPETLEAGAMSGAILETWVISEILKSYWHTGIQAPIHYYRDKDKREIDLLIIKNNIAYPVEIKKTTTPKKDSIRHFKALERLNLTVGEGGVICLAELALPITEKFQCIPVAAL